MLDAKLYLGLEAETSLTLIILRVDYLLPQLTGSC